MPTIKQIKSTDTHGPKTACSKDDVPKAKSKMSIKRTIEQLMPEMGNNIEQHGASPDLSVLSFISFDSSSSDSEIDASKLRKKEKNK